MNTNDDIELHDLQTIEANLRMDQASDGETREGEAAVTNGVMVGASSAFMVP